MLLAPGRCGSNFMSVFFKLILQITILSISWEFDLKWLLQHTFDEKSTFVKVMARCY